MASHLTLEEREVIAHMHRVGKLQTQIAKRLRRSKSTISRELRRNRSRNGYRAVAAQRKASKRRSQRPWVCKLERSEVRRYVRERLRQRWSPDEIAGRSHSDFPHDRRQQISHQTIYTWIRSEDALGKHWQRYLRRLGRKRPDWENRGRMRACVSIEGRPAVVDRRSRYGDWEGDHACGSAEDLDFGQRQGVRRTRAVGSRSRVEGLLCQTVLRVAARHEREHQRPDPAVLSQRHGPGQHPRASVYQGPASSQQPPEKTPGLSNFQPSPRLTTRCCD